jgi:Protein of unknown function (DUF3024)
MAIRPLDRARITTLLTECCDRVPHRVRDQLRHGFTIAGNTVELFEERPHYLQKDRWIQEPVAKFRFVATRELWQLYCMRRDLKWHSYALLPIAGTFEILFREVEADPTGIFWG